MLSVSPTKVSRSQNLPDLNAGRLAGRPSVENPVIIKGSPEGAVKAAKSAWSITKLFRSKSMERLKEASAKVESPRMEEGTLLSPTPRQVTPVVGAATANVNSPLSPLRALHAQLDDLAGMPREIESYEVHATPLAKALFHCAVIKAPSKLPPSQSLKESFGYANDLAEKLATLSQDVRKLIQLGNAQGAKTKIDEFWVDENSNLQKMVLVLEKAEANPAVGHREQQACTELADRLMDLQSVLEKELKKLANLALGALPPTCPVPQLPPAPAQVRLQDTPSPSPAITPRPPDAALQSWNGGGPPPEDDVPPPVLSAQGATGPATITTLSANVPPPSDNPPPPADVPPPSDNPPPPDDLPPPPDNPPPPVVTTPVSAGSTTFTPPPSESPPLLAVQQRPLDDSPPPFRKADPALLAKYSDDADQILQLQLARAKAKELADELRAIVAACGPGASLEAVKHGGKEITGVRATKAKLLPLAILPGRRQAQLKDLQDGLRAITRRIRDNSLLMDSGETAAAADVLEQQFIYNETLAELDTAEVLKHFKTVIAVVDLQPVNDYVEQSLALIETAHSELAQGIFERNGGRSVADEISKNARLANVGPIGIPSSPSPLEQTLAGLQPLYSKLGEWSNAENKGGSNPTPEIQRMRHFNKLLHEHLSAIPFLRNTLDSTGAIGARMTQALARTNDMLATLTKAASATPLRLADFKQGCGILAANFSNDVRLLLTLGHALSTFAQRDELNDEERKLVGDMSNVLTKLGQQMVAPGSPYMKLYQFTAAAARDDASAQRLLGEARQALGIGS